MTAHDSMRHRQQGRTGGAAMAHGSAKKTIRQLRQARGWTQEQVARRVGVAQGTVSQWEHGNRRPYRRNLQRLAELFGISVEDIALRPVAQQP